MGTAERIYSASISEQVASVHLAERLARKIEDDIAFSNARPGLAMGSLRELSERYEVGRAAAREAVALLERRRLGRLRPGPSGGFILAKPDVEAIGAELADHFRMIGITGRQFADAREAVDLMAAWLAARARPGAGDIAALPSPESAGSEIAWHLDIRAGLAVLSGEPVTALFIACLNALTADFVDHGASRADWRTRAQSSHAALCKALATRTFASVTAESAELDRDLRASLRQDDDVPPPPMLTTARQADDRTLSALVARRLAADIVRSSSAGERLGSEWDLCERFSVSRATLRQAIRLLQDKGLVECRRGRGNGLIVHELRGTGSMRLVLAFLIGQQMDPKAAGTIMFQLNRFVPALAVNRAGKDQRASLAHLVKRVRSSDPIDRYDLLRLVQRVSQLSESPIIDLFSRCLAAYEARFHPSLREQLPVNIQTDYLDLLEHLLDTVEPGDAAWLEWAKAQSAPVMQEMSCTRPI